MSWWATWWKTKAGYERKCAVLAESRADEQAQEIARLTAEVKELRGHLKDAHAAVNQWIHAEQVACAKVLAWEGAAMGLIAMDDSRLSPIEVKLKRMLPASLPAKPSGGEP